MVNQPPKDEWLQDRIHRVQLEAAADGVDYDQAKCDITQVEVSDSIKSLGVHLDKNLILENYIPSKSPALACFHIKKSENIQEASTVIVFELV